MDMDRTAPIRYCAPMSESRYPIGAVAVLTGLTVDTLRAWERRHRVVTPSRDERGRVYDDADVRRLQLVAAAVSRGHAVGRLARLDDGALAALLHDAEPGARRGAAGRSGGGAATARRRAGAPADAGPALGAPLGRVLAALRRFDASEVEREIGRVAADAAAARSGPRVGAAADAPHRHRVARRPPVDRRRSTCCRRRCAACSAASSAPCRTRRGGRTC